MEKAVSAADANRQFSKLLRTVQNGQSVTVTSHGKPVARITPVSGDDRSAKAARSVLFSRLKRGRVVKAAVLNWRDASAVMETSAAVIVNATDLASDPIMVFRFGIRSCSPRRRRPSADCCCPKICRKASRGGV